MKKTEGRGKTKGSEEIKGLKKTEETEATDGTVEFERTALTGETENKFTKEQLLCSKRFRERRDIVDALLTDGERYTIKTVEQKIENYRKGKVN